MMNIWILSGRLTAEPELKVTTDGTKVCSFTLAVDKDYKPKGAEKKTNFFKCEAWRQTAEFISKYFHKGNMIAVQGKGDNDNWTDRDGNKREKTKNVIDKAWFCESKKEMPVEKSTVPPIYYEVPDEEDTPF